VWRDGGDGTNAGPQLAGAGAVGAVAEAEFIDSDGTVRREPLSRRWSLAFERVPPVRGFPSFRGNATGRAGGGSPAQASMWATSPGWSGIG
jgi:hypothetical protein